MNSAQGRRTPLKASCFISAEHPSDRPNAKAHHAYGEQYFSIETHQVGMENSLKKRRQIQQVIPGAVGGPKESREA